MARPKKQIQPTPTENLVGKGENLSKFDLFMVVVNRSMGKKQQTVTKSVEIGKKLRSNIKIGKDSAELQNNLQDWQNKSGMGQNIVQWLFPAGSVRSGLEYAASEQFAKDDEGDETSHKILFIDVNKCLSNAE